MKHDENAKVDINTIMEAKMLAPKAIFAIFVRPDPMYLDSTERIKYHIENGARHQKYRVVKWCQIKTYGPAFDQRVFLMCYLEI